METESTSIHPKKFSFYCIELLQENVTPINSINFHNILKVFLDKYKGWYKPHVFEGKRWNCISAKRAGRNGMRKEAWFGLTSKYEGVWFGLVWFGLAWPVGWVVNVKSWPIISAIARFTAFGPTFAIKIVFKPQKKFLTPWVCVWKLAPKHQNPRKMATGRKCDTKKVGPLVHFFQLIWLPLHSGKPWEVFPSFKHVSWPLGIHLKKW